MNKVKNSKATTKRLVASGIMLFGGLLTFTNKPQDVHAEDGAAPVKETNNTATESSNVAVLKSSVKSTSESGSKVETTETDAEGVEQEAASEASETEAAVVNDNESAAEESTSDTTGAAASAKTAEVTETPEATPSTAPAATPAPADETAPASGTQEMSKTVTLDGKQYTFSGVANDSAHPLFVNKVTDVAAGTTHTYSFMTGSGSTSAYYYRGSDGLYRELEGASVTVEKTATALLKTVVSTEWNVKVTESLTFTDDGRFEHTVTMTNLGSSELTDISLGVMLDTMLDSNDRIEIYSSGSGGAFLKNSELTLYTQGLENANVYAGQWTGSSGDILHRTPVTGNYGDNLMQGHDSAIEYETGKINLAPNASYSFKFAERLHTGPQDLGKLTVRYVDTEGNTLRPDQVLGDVVGESYAVEPALIEGYVFDDSIGTLNGKYTLTDKTLTLVYRRYVLPETEGSKKPAKPVTPAKPTTPVKPATPTKSTPAPAPVVAPRANKALPQTGEKSDSTISAIGVGILATLTLFGFAKTKKHENN